jgi:site-specific recombinase XerD
MRSSSVPRALDDAIQQRIAEAERLFLSATTNRYALRDVLLIGLLYWHGLTVQDVIGLTNGQIEAGQLTFTRNNGIVINRILDPVLQQLVDNLEQGKYLATSSIFPSQLGKAMDRQTVNYIIRQTSNKAKVDPFTPKELRHMRGHQLAADGLTAQEVANFLGLKTPRCAIRYFGVNQKPA